MNYNQQNITRMPRDRYASPSICCVCVCVWNVRIMIWWLRKRKASEATTITASNDQFLMADEMFRFRREKKMLCEPTNRSLPLPSLLAFSSLVDLPFLVLILCDTNAYRYIILFRCWNVLWFVSTREVRPIEACPSINFLQLFILIWFMCMRFYGNDECFSMQLHWKYDNG